MAYDTEGFPDRIGASSYEKLMRSWCVRETSHWVRQTLDYGSMLEEFERLHQSVKGVSYFEIRDGAVSAREEPQHLPAGGGDRQSLYLAFLRETVRLFCPDLSVDLVIYWR